MSNFIIYDDSSGSDGSIELPSPPKTNVVITSKAFDNNLHPPVEPNYTRPSNPQVNIYPRPNKHVLQNSKKV